LYLIHFQCALNSGDAQGVRVPRRTETSRPTYRIVEKDRVAWESFTAA